MIKAPHIIFESKDTGSVIGTGTVHVISIEPDFEIHGRKGTLRAQHRLKSHYTYLSHAFSDSDQPVLMTWVSGDTGFVDWDFVCLDENQNPVAKFTAHIWGVKRMGKVEFMGPRALSEAVRDEVVVVGCTLYYCMCVRMNNVFNLVGSAIVRPGRETETDSGK